FFATSKGSSLPPLSTALCHARLRRLNHSEGSCCGSASQSASRPDFAEDLLQSQLLRNDSFSTAENSELRPEEEFGALLAVVSRGLPAVC
uniref:High mobility group 20A n=1 Tax=Pseudonaja textilis TaxID=8673 RepID=A0A670YTA0_PSETE